METALPSTALPPLPLAGDGVGAGETDTAAVAGLGDAGGLSGSEAGLVPGARARVSSARGGAGAACGRPAGAGNGAGSAPAGAP